MQANARATAGGYRSIADSLAEVLDCDVALVRQTVTDLIQCGALPRSRGRRIEPVLGEGLKLLTFAVVARSMGFSRVGSRQVAMQWSETESRHDVIRFDQRPTAKCEVRIGLGTWVKVWPLAEA